MIKETTLELVNESYRKGFNDGMAAFCKERAKLLKIRSAGFCWKMQAVFIEDSEGLCECENKQVAQDFHEMMFTKVVVPANDLYIANVWGKALCDLRRGEVQL